MAITNYSDPLYIDWFTDGSGNKISIAVTGENHVVTNGAFYLDYIPDEFHKVTFTDPVSMTELKVSQTISTATEYKVDYTTGKVYVHSDLEGDTVVVNFYKRGIVYYPSSRLLYDGSPSVTVKDKIDSLEATDTAKQAEYDAHIAATSDRHSTDDVDNDSTVTGSTSTAALNALKSQMDTLVVGAANTTIGVFSMSGTGVDTITATYATLTYFTGLKVHLTTAGVNTTAATLNINALGAKSIKTKDRSGTKTSLVGGEMPSIANLEYDGTDFILLNGEVASYTVSATATAEIIPLSSTALKSRLEATISGNTQTPYDQYTKFLMLAEGADASTPATDSTGKALTWAGNAQLDTAQYRFGTSSMLFDGTGDYVTVTDANNELDIGTSDFCIEFWVRFNSVAAAQIFVDFRQSTDSDIAPRLYMDGTTKKFVFEANTLAIVGTTVATTGVWYHVSLVRSSNVTKLYVNGGQEGSIADTSNYIAVSQIIVGARYATYTASVNGWLDHLRISVGTPRYTSNYTPLPMSVLSSDKMRILSVGKNLFDKSKATYGYAISNTTGALTVSATYFSSDFMRVSPSTTYKSSNSGGQGAYYDVNKNYISGFVTLSSMTTPSNASYVRVSTTIANIETYQFELGSVATTYTAYTETSAICPVELKKISSTVYDSYNGNDGKHTKNISDWITLSGNYTTWSFYSDGTGMKALRTAGSIITNPAVNTSMFIKHNGKKLSYDVNALVPTTADTFYDSNSTGRPVIVVADTESGWDDAWTNATSFTGLDWNGLIKAYMNGWKMTTANVDVASCVWTGIVSGTVKNAGAADYTHVTTTIDTGFTPYKMIYQLATPVITNYYPNILTAEPSGTIYCTPFISDYDFYDSGCVVTNSSYPIDALEYVNIVNKTDGSLTPVALSTCTVAAGGLSFTSTALTAEDLVDFGYSHKDLSTVADVTYSYSNNLKAAVDGNVKDIQLLDNKVEKLTALERSRLRLATVTIGTTSATSTYCMFIAPTACDLVNIQFVNKDGVTASDTDYWTFAVTDKGSAGAGTDVIVSKTTKTTGGQAISAYTKWDLGALNAQYTKLAAGDVVTITITKSASATTMNEGLLMVSYIDGN